MPKHNKGDVLVVTNFTCIKANLGREVRLMEWLEPNSSLNYHDEMVFHGGKKGAWIVTATDGKAMVGRGVNGMPMVSNIVLINDENLGKVYVKGSTYVSPKEVKEINDLLRAGPSFILAPKEFEAFEEMLKANPLSQNKALQKLLSQPNPWS